MSLAARAYGRFLDLCGLAAGLLICAIALSITGEVVLRNMAGRTVPWLLESSEYALFIAAFLGAPWVLRQGGHIRVDVVLNLADARTGRWIELGSDVVSTLICGILFYFGVLATVESFASNIMIYKSIIIPEWWVLIFVPLSFFLLSLEFVLRALRFRREEPTAPAGTAPREP